MLLWLILIIPGSSTGQQNNLHLTRKYKVGDVYRYRMTTNVVHNDKWQSTIIAVCELKVVLDSNKIPYDEIKWISKKVIKAKDSTEYPEEIKNTSPYRISLHPDGKLDIPPIQESGMTGEITDLNTFFVAISPKLGIGQLHKPHDNFTKPENVKGNFANGKDILKGEDCLEVTAVLQRSTRDQAVVQTDFMPPSVPCLQYLSQEMTKPVAGETINNFQMVRVSANDKVNLFYGSEKFNINSTISSKDGKLQSAYMTNTLFLTLKLNCEKDYTGCQHTMPFTIDRKISLVLLP
ncbi:MAG: hypothetical protein ACTHMC_10970 [Pseudobacter sp.]|uniref:hypothetical protein n=1 Tax=Pseudobacter sp. TaxID=2045420 RepID=UPI003F7DDF2D